MVRPEETKILEALKAAKTGREKLMSFGAQSPGRDLDRLYKLFGLYADKKPEMIDVFAHTPFTQVVERGILDRKTRLLVLLGIIMGMQVKEGIVSQCENAKAGGCTEEEIMEVAFLAAYQAAKGSLVFSAQALAEGFEKASEIEVLKS